MVLRFKRYIEFEESLVMLSESRKDKTSSKISHRGFLSEIVNHHVFATYIRLKDKEYITVRKKGMSHHDAVEHAHKTAMDLMTSDKHSEHGRLRVTNLVSRAKKLPDLKPSQLEKLKKTNPKAYANHVRLTKIRKAYEVLGDEGFRKLSTDTRYATLDMIHQIHTKDGEIMSAHPTGQIGSAGVKNLTGGKSTNADTLLKVRLRGKTGRHQSKIISNQGISLKVQSDSNSSTKVRTSTGKVHYGALSKYNDQIQELADKVESDYKSKLAAHNKKHGKALRRVFESLKPGQTGYGRLDDNLTITQDGWSHIRDLAETDPEIAEYYKGVKKLHGERHAAHEKIQKPVIKKAMETLNDKDRVQFLSELFQKGVGKQEVPTDIYAIRSLEGTEKGRRTNRARAIKKNKEEVDLAKLRFKEKPDGTWGLGYEDDSYFRIYGNHDTSKEGNYRYNWNLNPNAAGKPQKGKEPRKVKAKTPPSQDTPPTGDWRSKGKSLFATLTGANR